MPLFTPSEARAYDKRQLSDVEIYPDALIQVKELAIRARFEAVIGVALEPTQTVESHDGDGGHELVLRYHNPRSERPPRPVDVSKIELISSDGTVRELSTAELASVVCYPDKLVWPAGVFPAGYRNVRITYTHGYQTPPADIRQAALQAVILAPPDGLVPDMAPSRGYEGEEGGIRWSREKNPERGRWFGHENVDAVLREYRAREMEPLIR